MNVGKRILVVACVLALVVTSASVALAKPTTPAKPVKVTSWNLATDYLARPDDTQPVVKDAAGNSVWYIKYGAIATDSTSFTLMAIWLTDWSWILDPVTGGPAPAGLMGWGSNDNGFCVNGSKQDVLACPWHPYTWKAGTVNAGSGSHYSGTPYTVMEWKSPFRGYATASISLTDLDPAGGYDGVEFWVMKNDTVLNYVEVPEGLGEARNVATGSRGGWG